MDYTIFWLVALVLFIVIEIATMGLTTIWFGAAPGGTDCSVFYCVFYPDLFYKADGCKLF